MLRLCRITIRTGDETNDLLILPETSHVKFQKTPLKGSNLRACLRHSGIPLQICLVEMDSHPNPSKIPILFPPQHSLCHLAPGEPEKISLGKVGRSTAG